MRDILMKLNVFFAYVLLVAVFSSCKQRPVEYEYKQQIVKAKTVDLKDGNTRYNIAFTDGDSETFSFGLYSKYEVVERVEMGVYVIDESKEATYYSQEALKNHGF